MKRVWELPPGTAMSGVGSSSGLLLEELLMGRLADVNGKYNARLSSSAAARNSIAAARFPRLASPARRDVEPLFLHIHNVVVMPGTVVLQWLWKTTMCSERMIMQEPFLSIVGGGLIAAIITIVFNV